MKRADLYRSRRTRPRSSLSSHTPPAHTVDSGAKILPLCHWFQLFLCIFLLLLMIAGQSFMKDEHNHEFQSTLTQYLTTTIDLQHREWSGTLKEILFTKE